MAATCDRPAESTALAAWWHKITTTLGEPQLAATDRQGRLHSLPRGTGITTTLGEPQLAATDRQGRLRSLPWWHKITTTLGERSEVNGRYSCTPIVSGAYCTEFPA